MGIAAQFNGCGTQCLERFSPSIEGIEFALLCTVQNTLHAANNTRTGQRLHVIVSEFDAVASSVIFGLGQLPELDRVVP